MVRRVRKVLFVCVCSGAASTAPAFAQGWFGTSGSNGDAMVGYAQADLSRLVMFGCKGVSSGDVEIAFGGIASGLSTETEYPVTVSVDGLAFLLRGRLRANAMEGDNDVVRIGPLAEVQPMIEALKRGSYAEISTPSGRYTLPLAGSGKALAMLDGSCGAGPAEAPGADDGPLDSGARP